MTDNEIVKALECCMGCDCKECPYDGDAEIEAVVCMGKLIVEALKLINRQKAEIERLEKLVIEKHTEINRLDEYIQYTRAEAIKEFAERLKPKLRNNAHVSPFASNLNDVIIDNLVKEMTEETK